MPAMQTSIPSHQLSLMIKVKERSKQPPMQILCRFQAIQKMKVIITNITHI